MKQLTLKELEYAIRVAKARYKDEWQTIPVYIGDDDEMNGIHNAWFVDIVDNKMDKEDRETFVELINERGGNTEFNDKAIVISQVVK